MNDVPRKDWQNSFERVNLRPSKRVPFVQWVKKHEEQTRSADSLFRTEGNGLFDAMPALWKNMSEEKRAEVCSLYAKFEASRGDPYSVENLTELVKAGVHIEDVFRLRGCYLVTKQDSTVLKDPLPPRDINLCDTTTGQQTILSKDFNGFEFAPDCVLKPYLEDKEKHGKLDESKISTLDKLDESNLKVQEVVKDRLSMKTELELVNAMPISETVTCWPKDRSRQTAATLFRHMCNFTAATHGYANDGDLTPSNYLDVHVSGDQRKLLNPTYRDVLIGEILDQSSGVKATKKLAKRRIEFVHGNVNSYARVLNGQAQMDAIKTYNDLAASLATYNAEKHQRDEEKKKEKKKKDEEKEAKKRLQKEKEAQEHEIILPGCREDVEIRGKLWVLGCSVKRKKEILKHYFCHDKPLYKLNQSETNELIEKYFATLPGADSNEGTVSNSTTAAEVDAGEASVDEDPAVRRALHDMMESVANAEAEEEGVEADEEEVEVRRTGRKRKRTERAEALAAEKM